MKEQQDDTPSADDIAPLFCSPFKGVKKTLMTRSKVPIPRTGLSLAGPSRGQQEGVFDVRNLILTAIYGLKYSLGQYR
jgi:hypothetical protein